MWILSAHAAVFAVVPFAGSADVERPGLGRALAATLVTDLHRAGVQLVERERVDAVLDELHLSSTTFIDREHAVQLGRGLAAENLVLGSFSIESGTLVLDLRVVHTASSRITATGRASGPLPSFPQVQAQATSELLMALGVVAGSGPAPRQTAQLEAFEAYAAGLDAERRGAVEDARLAYGRAIDADATYAAASEALARARQQIAAQRAKPTGGRRLEQAQRVVDATDQLAASSSPETETVVALAFRWTALHDLARHCDRQDEMIRFVERHGWVLPALSPTHVQRVADELAVRWKLDRSASPDWGPVAARTLPWSGRIALFADLRTFFSAQSKIGALTSVNQCLLPDDELDLLVSLAARAKGKPGLQGVGMGELFEYQWLGRRAWLFGADASWQERLRRLEMSKRPGLPGYELHQRFRDVAMGYAASYAKLRLVRGAFSGGELLALARSGLPARGAEVCAVAQKRWDAAVAGVLPAYESAVVYQDGSEEPILDQLAPLARAAAVFGCIPGHRKRVSTVAQLQGWVQAAVDGSSQSASSGCAAERGALRRASEVEAQPALASPGAQVDLAVQLYEGVVRGCVAGSF